jgi:DNA polymerase III sliding clamp (beta) subunit (PCNA family)
VEAADGYRLSRRRLGLESEAADWDIVVPAGALGMAARMGSADTVEIWAGECWMRFELGETLGDRVLTTETVEGQYPDLDVIIPPVAMTHVVVGREALERAVKACQLFAIEGLDSVAISVDEGRLRLVGTGERMGDSVIEVAARVKGPGVMASVNGAYMTEFLGHVGSEQVVIDFLEESRPVALYAGEDGPDFVHVIMPLHLEGGVWERIGQRLGGLTA